MLHHPLLPCDPVLDYVSQPSVACSSWSPALAVHHLVALLKHAAPDLLAHGVRTSRYAVRLAQSIDFDRNELRDLRRAAWLHDIGRLTLNTDHDEAQEALPSDEYAAVQSHPRYGAMMLARHPGLRRPALWVAHHHERWDGAGYPYGIRAEHIPLGARILALADAYDLALTTVGARESAGRCLTRLAGSQLDPELVQHFLSTAESGSFSPNREEPARGAMRGCGRPSLQDAPSHGGGGRR
jgi:HD-GYP domain-containing protein (c-di-GMP phosphodiesterase class II)